MGINSISTYEKGLLRANLTLRGHVVKYQMGVEGDYMSERYTLDSLTNNGHTAALTPLDLEGDDIAFIRTNLCRIYIGDKDYPLEDMIRFVISEM